MREILFRGKRIDNGEWAEGCFGQHTSLDAFIIVRPYPTITGDWSALGFYEVATDTVGQYTGLQDKNGEKIFEGDIVEGIDFTPEDGGYGVVSFEDGAFKVSGHNLEGTFYDNYYGSDFEVIGNIHDNPELMEVLGDG